MSENMPRNIFGTWEIYIEFPTKRKELNKNKLNSCKYLDDIYILSSNYHTLFIMYSFFFFFFYKSLLYIHYTHTVKCIEIVFLEHNFTSLIKIVFLFYSPKRIL